MTWAESPLNLGMNYMTGEFFVDSNVIIYAFDTADKKKHQAAKDLLTKCWTGKVKLIVSTQNLSEFFVNVTHKISKPISESEAYEIVQSIVDSNCWIKIAPKAETIPKAIKLFIENKNGYWNALIAATMMENGIFTIITENTKDFAKIKEITAKNPFVT